MNEITTHFSPNNFFFFNQHVKDQFGKQAYWEEREGTLEGIRHFVKGSIILPGTL